MAKLSLFAFFTSLIFSANAFGQEEYLDFVWSGVAKSQQEHLGAHKGSGALFLENYYAGIPVPFNAADTKLGFFPSNWSKDFESVHYVPELVKTITTFGINPASLYRGDDVGILRLRKAGHLVYSPMKMATNSSQYGITDFGPDKVFDLSSLSWRQISEPDLQSTGRYSKTFHPTGYFPYQYLYFALNPSGTLVARLFRVDDAQSGRSHDALVLWDINTGKVLRVIKVPTVFTSRYGSDEKKPGFKECESGYENQIDSVCGFTGEIKRALPATPFFISESQLILPITYQAESEAEISVKFFLQPIDISESSDPRWLFKVAGNEFLLEEGVESFVYESDRGQQGSAKEDIQRKMRSLRYWANRDGLLFPAFSLEKIESVVDGLSYSKVIVVSGASYYPKRARFISTDLKVLPIDFQLQVKVPSFYPSIYRPYPFYKPEPGFSPPNVSPYDLHYAIKDETAIKMGTDIRAVWKDLALPDGLYMTISETVRDYAKVADGLDYSLSTYEPIRLVKPSENSWAHSALTISKLSERKNYEFAEDFCEEISDLKIELCNKTFFETKDVKKLHSGNFFVKEGSPLKLEIAKIIDNDKKEKLLDDLVYPLQEGCWYKTCTGTHKKTVESKLPTAIESKLVLEFDGTFTCTYKQPHNPQCGLITYKINSYVQTPSSRYTVDGMKVPNELRQ